MPKLGIEIYAILALLIIALTEYAIIEHLESNLSNSYLEISSLTKDMDDQNDAINRINLESKLKDSIVAKAKADALKLKNQYDKAAEKILSQKVPANCDQAIMWAAEQAPSIYEIWLDES